MPRIDLPPVPDTDTDTDSHTQGDAHTNTDDLSRASTLSPAFAKAMHSYAAAIYGPISLSMREREAVRMRIAQINQCQLCLNYRFPELANEGVDETFYEQVAQWRRGNNFSTREKLAIEYAEKFLTDHLSMDDAFFKTLKQHFSAKELFELSGITAGLLANGRLMQVLQLDQTCAL